MLRLISKITIKQQPVDTYPSRNKVIVFDFVNGIDISSTWQNLSDTGSIKFPKKIYFRDEKGKKINIYAQNVGWGTDANPPIFLRGDKISIELGYEYEFEAFKLKTETNKVFEGFITAVNSKLPIELSFEDYMWKLKQIQAPNKTFKGSEYSLETMLKELIEPTGLTVKTTLNNKPLVTKFGDFTTQNETIAQVLERLQKDFRFESNFRGTELRSGMIVYWPDKRKDHIFKFQHNIISDDLVYKRKDDVKIGVEIHTHTQIVGRQRNKDGTFKKNKEKQDYFGYFDSKKELKIVPINEKPTTFDGEIRTINMLQMPYDQVKEFISKQLNRLSYEGYRGSFETYGLPMVQHGDIVQFVDDILPERNGRYMVKGVETTFGVDGFRQKIDIDIKVDDYSQAELEAGL